MTPEQRRRAATFTARRMREASWTSAALARSARIDPRTLRAFLKGERWPRLDVRQSIEGALGLSPGALVAVAVDGGEMDLRSVASADMLEELLRRSRYLDRGARIDPES